MLMNNLATIPGATSATAAGGSSSSSGVAGATIGGTDFLTLMLAQLKNQDPTSPVDSNTFLTQLAQLSQVQGINQLNSSFSQFSGSQAASLLGHTAMVPSSTATLATAGQAITGAVGVPQNSPQVTVNISNSAGVVVRTLDLKAQPAGLANFSWDGTMSNGAQAAAGTYTLSAGVQGVSSSTPVSTYVNGTIDSVTMGAGSTGLTLNVSGLGSVPYSSIQQISN